MIVLDLDLLQAFFWTSIPILGMLVGVSQQRGREYFPANLILGLGVGARTCYYLVFLVATRNVQATVDLSRDLGATYWAYGCQLTLMLWSFLLVLRVNHAPYGESIDWVGRLRKPTTQTVEAALVVLGRAERHGVLNLLAVDWAREDIVARRAVKIALEREDRRRALSRKGGIWRRTFRYFWWQVRRELYRARAERDLDRSLEAKRRARAGGQGRGP